MKPEARAAFVYVIHHVPSGRNYVGKSSRPEVRWQQHRTSRTQYLHRAIQKYGADSFLFVVVASCASEHQAYAAEKAWIKMLRTTEKGFGYNISSGGIGGSSGVPKSPEHRAKIAAAHLGKLHSPEHRAAMLGRVQSEATRAKISLAKTGRRTGPMPESTRAALAASNARQAQAAADRREEKRRHAA